MGTLNAEMPIGDGELLSQAVALSQAAVFAGAHPTGVC